MWVRKNDIEIQQTEQGEERSWRVYRPLVAAAIGVGASVLFGGVIFAEQRSAPAPLFAMGPIAEGMLVTAVAGYLLGIIFLPRRKIAQCCMICPACERSKKDDGNTACPCGGTFEPVAHYRWQADENE